MVTKLDYYLLILIAEGMKLKLKMPLRFLEKAKNV